MPAGCGVRMTDDFTIEVEFRGETLHYVEPDRMTSMEWYWTSGYSIVASSIRRWRHADGKETPVSDDERDEIVRRVVEYARREQGVTLRIDP
jgi:hypothetical protein